MINTKAVLKCKKCSDFSTFWEFSLQSHIKRSHGTLRMDLFNCNLAFIEKMMCPDWDYDCFLKVDFYNHLQRGHGQDYPKLINETQDNIKSEHWECSDCSLKSFSNFFVQYHNCKKHFKLELMKIEIFEKDVNDTLQKIKEEVNLESGNGKWLDCDNSPFKSQTKRKLSRKRSAAIKLFTCQECPFKTEVKHIFKIHNLRKHTPDEKIKWFECAQCPYKAKLKYVLKCHILAKHTPEEKIKRFVCGQCPYKSNNKYTLNAHRDFQHKSSAEIKWFMCQHCPYKAKRKQHIKFHNLRKHTPEERIKWFICTQCPYRGKSQSNFISHQACKHKSSAEIKWFECQECPYKAKRNTNLKRHIMGKHTPKENSTLQ